MAESKSASETVFYIYFSKEFCQLIFQSLSRPCDIDTDKLDTSDFDELKLFLNTSGLKTYLDWFVKHDITLKSLLGFTETDFAKVFVACV
jgi:hypothetical protein